MLGSLTVFGSATYLEGSSVSLRVETRGADEGGQAGPESLSLSQSPRCMCARRQRAGAGPPRSLHVVRGP